MLEFGVSGFPSALRAHLRLHFPCGRLAQSEPVADPNVRHDARSALAGHATAAASLRPDCRICRCVHRRYALRAGSF